MRKVSTKWPKIITCVCAVGIVMYIVTSLQSGVFSWNTFSIKLVTYGLWPFVLWSIWAFVCLVSEEKKQAVSQTTKAAKGQVKWLAFALLFVVLTSIIVVHFSNTPAATRADNRDVAEAYFNRGFAYGKEGKYDLAISDYTKAIEINPRYAEAYYNRGIVYYKKGEPVPAISDFNKAIEMNPDFAMAYYNRGFVYAEEDEPVLTISDYTKAIEINPDYAEAYHNRGFTYYEEGARDLAISDYTRAIEINPKLANVHYHRGVAYLEEGAFDLAILDYTKAIEMNPDCAETYFLRGIAYYEKGEPVLAISDYTKAISIEPDNITHYSLGIIYNKAGRYEEAIKAYKQTINQTFAYGKQGTIEYKPNLGQPTTEAGQWQVAPVGPANIQGTPVGPANRRGTTGIDPYTIFNKSVKEFENYYKRREETLRSYNLPQETHNKIIAQLQQEFDKGKFKFRTTKLQLDTIKQGIASGQIDPMKGLQAQMQLVAPQGTVEAMFP